MWNARLHSTGLGFSVEIHKAPQFAMIRAGGPMGGTIGLLARDITERENLQMVGGYCARDADRYP
jgi:hypothetical protein